MRSLLTVLGVAAIAASGLVASASARQHPVSAGQPSLVASSNPAVVGEPVTFSGCGYTPGSWVYLAVNNSAGGVLFNETPTIDASGCFQSFSAFVAVAPGVFEAVTNQHANKASVALTVN